MTDLAHGAADGHHDAISSARQQARLLFLDAFLHELGQPLNLATMARHNLAQALHPLHMSAGSDPLADAVIRRLALLEKSHQRLGALLATYRAIGRPPAAGVAGEAAWQEFTARLNLLMSVEARSEAAVLEMVMDGCDRPVTPPLGGLDVVVALFMHPNLGRAAAGLTVRAVPGRNELRLSATHGGDWDGWVISAACSDAAGALGLAIIADGRVAKLSWAAAAS
jgi:hypothetical protein